MRNNYKKALMLIGILVMIIIASFSVASAKTIKNYRSRGDKWQYGWNAVGNGGYSYYYHPSNIHYAKVTLTNGKSNSDWNFGKNMGYFCNGWAYAKKRAAWASPRRYEAGLGYGR